MQQEITDICDFTMKYMDITSQELYGNSLKDKYTIARYFIWYYMHCEKGISTSIIAKHFKRTRRAIFEGIKKHKECMIYQIQYKNMYNDFAEKYKGVTPSY